MAFTIPVKKTIRAYPEQILKDSAALFQHICKVRRPRGSAVKVPASWHEDVTSFTTTPPTPVIAVSPRSLGYIAPYCNLCPKNILAGLLSRKLTREKPLWVFEPVFTKFERDNFHYSALYSAKVDFIDFESQNVVEEITASGNTKKRSNGPDC